jgi:hypothetical protein
MLIHPNVFYKFLDIFLSTTERDIWIVNYNIKYPTRLSIKENGKVINSTIELVLVQNPKQNVIGMRFAMSGFRNNPVMEYTVDCTLRNITLSPPIDDLEINHFISAVLQYDPSLKFNI